MDGWAGFVYCLDIWNKDSLILILQAKHILTMNKSLLRQERRVEECVEMFGLAYCTEIVKK